MEVSVALQGTLDTFALPDVLRLLAATKKSGRLRITGGRGTGSAWVVTGEVVGVEATHAPHANEPVDALFELLRFEEGAFTFDAEGQHAEPRPPVDIETLLTEAEALLAEWRCIEAVVPSMDAWVTLARQLAAGEVTIAQERWITLVAVGSGATVRRIADELCLAELPVSRAVKDMVEAGLADIAPSAPALASGAAAPALAPSTAVRRDIDPAASGLPLLHSADDQAEAPAEPAPRGPRARRAKAAAEAPPAEPARFVPLDLPGHVIQTYGASEPEGEAAAAAEEAPADDPAETLAVDDLAAAFPGLANRITDPSAPAVDEDLARQLATLSPRAADAVRAAAEATTDEEREAALSDVDADDETLNRGLLLKFLSR